MGNLCTHLSSRNKVAPLEAKLFVPEGTISSNKATIADKNRAIASQNRTIASQNRTILAQSSEISNLKKLITVQAEDLNEVCLAKARAVQQARDLDQMLANKEIQNINRLRDLERKLRSDLAVKSDVIE